MAKMSDSGKIAAAFHRSAAEYDQHVSVQKRVVINLAKYVETHLVLPHPHPNPSPEGERSLSSFLPFQGGGQEGDEVICRSRINILDVGTGTGTLLHNLKRIYPEAFLCGVDLAYNMCQRAAAKLDECLVVNGDAEKIPFMSGAFDLVVSTSALQWVGSISQSIHELRRVLKPGGTLCIAFFCDGTLRELQNCYREAICRHCDENSELADRLHRFRSVNDIKSILEGMDFEQVILNSETEKDWYDDVTSLLRSIKSIGAGAVAGGSVIGLGWRGIINKTSRLYREYYGQDSRIPATYEVLYLYARTPVSGPM